MMQQSRAVNLLRSKLHHHGIWWSVLRIADTQQGIVEVVFKSYHTESYENDRLEGYNLFVILSAGSLDNRRKQWIAKENMQQDIKSNAFNSVNYYIPWDGLPHERARQDVVWMRSSYEGMQVQKQFSTVLTFFGMSFYFSYGRGTCIYQEEQA